MASTRCRILAGGATLTALALGACGGGAPSSGGPLSSSSTSATSSPAASSSTPAATTAAPVSPTPDAVTQGSLTAVAQRTYLSSGSTCETHGSGGAYTAANYASCPLTATLVNRLIAAQNNQGPGGGHDVLCACQAAPQTYAVRDSTVSGSGGTVTVQGVYGPDLVTFTVTIVRQNDQLLVDDITVESTACSHPQEIDATSC